MIAERGSLFDARSFGAAENDRERVLLAEINRLRKQSEEDRESALFYLGEFKRTYSDYLDLKEPDRGR